MKPILFYHFPCPDGFGAAYAFWKKYKDEIEYFPISHNTELPSINGRDVFFADIAASREIIIDIAKNAKSLLILDHHISRYEELKDLECYHFDNNHSGAMISWRYLFPDKEPPAIIKFVEDRDIWRWSLDGTKEVLAVVDSAQFSFEEWDLLNEELERDSQSIISSGTAIIKYCKSLMDRIKRDAHTLNVRGFEVPAVNTPFFRSEILSELCKDKPFSVGYNYDGERFIISLRSTDDGEDVSKIAASFPNGGGHRNAAGFSVSSLDELR